jgi:3-hydroxyisobutyrate dehydrogenase-like beta-hydroxyacid dehydrogenase
VRIAFIGLSPTGIAIAERLARDDGLELALYDVVPARLAEARALGRTAASVGDAAEGSDAVFTLLPADPHVRAVADEVARDARPGRVFADFSTIAPATIDAVALQLAGAGMPTLGVTIARGTAGELGLFVGGEAPLAEALAAPFDAMATEVRLVGTAGAAKAIKLADHMVSSCIDVAICEALVIGQRLGVSADAISSALLTAGGDSWALRNHIIKHVLPGDLGQFTMRHLARDVRLFTELAAVEGTPALLAGAALASYRGTVADGFEDDYHPIVMRWLERSAGSGEPRGPADDHLTTLIAGVVAIQALASHEALAALRARGIAPAVAAGHLMSGSAANESLEGAARALEAGELPPVGEPLARAAALAAAVDVPALMLEVGHHTTRGA